VFLSILTSIIVFIQVYARSWNAMIKRIDGDFYLFKKGEKVSGKICLLINLKAVGKYYFGRYLSIVDEADKEIFLFKGLSREEATEVSSIISTKTNIPVKLIE